MGPKLREDKGIPPGRMRSTGYAVTAYNDNIKKIQDTSTYPPFVRSVAGGLEKCPTTGTIHYQAYVDLVSTQRGTAILQWLPGAHIGPVKNTIACEQYCLKKETSIGEKTTLYHPDYVNMPRERKKGPKSQTSYQPQHVMLDRLARMAIRQWRGQAIHMCEFGYRSDEEPPGDHVRPKDKKYVTLLRGIVREDLSLINYSSSDLKKKWIDSFDLFINAAVQENTSITHSPLEQAPESSDDEIEDLNSTGDEYEIVIN